MNILEDFWTRDSAATRGFPRGQAGFVHELRAAAGCAVHATLAARLLAGRPGRPVLLVGPAADFYPPGLAWAGLDPARCLFAAASGDAEVWAALEVALRGGMAGIAEGKNLSRLAARRLALAAKEGGGIGFVLRHAPRQTAQDSTAFGTRWFIAPAPGGMLRAERLYAKGAQPGVFFWQAEEVFDDEAPVSVPVVSERRHAAG